ncbi:hypothetical protein HanRHA438_Chr11g0498181 [Helianthus annuus]|nr:hypothetical protein HanRHA438_Chr11g0498181 [Helianthus annuus]
MAVIYSKKSKLVPLMRYKFGHMVIFHWMISFPFNQTESIFRRPLVAPPLASVMR